jgi:hypothetical protein
MWDPVSVSTTQYLFFSLALAGAGAALATVPSGARSAAIAPVVVLANARMAVATVNNTGLLIEFLHLVEWHRPFRKCVTALYVPDS